MAGRRTTIALVAIVVIGVGLAVAPVAFQMFTRAPGGGEMLDDFRPYMDEAVVASFTAHVDRIDAAAAEAGRVADPSGLPATSAFVDEWPELEADLRDLLATMDTNLDRYRAVDALPPFALFPWFFVLPGLGLAGLAVWGLARHRAGGDLRVPRRALVAMGLAVVAAPLVFQMFTRAPAGERMIDDFRPMMTTERLHGVQRAFVVIGAAEGELRLRLLPAEDAPSLPAVETFVAGWPRMSADMAPMIGAMADNLDRFAGIDALPPFGLFPWFFVIPGLLTAGLAGLAVRPRAGDADGDDPPPDQSAAGSARQEALT